ncbi:hypothetical protein OK349_14010 [Sphingomonas sp. BT-65]|uniref:hypothetical protein n=1 Tax=Sphingomonas sp. BT-65 TaxID=2989821 RepID=UPI002235470A|nr:hypothetical protein [Sphingomonas sp. BT-65]MCW4462828.1 hypothetical protein [Sphingomonas sp. BT-65]
MLTLLIALSVASEPPRVVTLPRQARTAAIRTRTARKPIPRVLPRPSQLCVTGSCSHATDTSYRFIGAVSPAWSAKMDVVKSTGVPCGLQGAPVCPKKGRRLLHASID